MIETSFHIPISAKQIERSRTHFAPEPIIEPLKKIKAAYRIKPEPKPIDPTKKVRKSRALKVKVKITSYALPKPKGAAATRDTDLFLRGNYVRGDGDTIIPHRPGSLDFLQWPSVGDSC